jgi:hypothetical protein
MNSWIRRTALLDETMTIAVVNPLPRLAEAAISGMIRAVSSKRDLVNHAAVIPFEI